MGSNLNHFKGLNGDPMIGKFRGKVLVQICFKSSWIADNDLRGIMQRNLFTSEIGTNAKCRPALKLSAFDVDRKSSVHAQNDTTADQFV